MRASIVSTWDGAEVVVPNADLISEKVTNWTLTHSRRRMTIPVGVAYGTDPEKAAQLILGVATDHKHVDTHPSPVCLFKALATARSISSCAPGPQRRHLWGLPAICVSRSSRLWTKRVSRFPSRSAIFICGLRIRRLLRRQD